jgi:hypothetical protein
MTLAINLIDQTTSGDVYAKTHLKLVSERMTLRELIALRIRDEVNRFNKEQQDGVFAGLVQPNDTEVAINGFRMRKPRQIDFDKQLNMAIEAFQSNGFFVLLDDQQIVDLDEPLTLREASDVSFIKLVPLVGG